MWFSDLASPHPPNPRNYPPTQCKYEWFVVRYDNLYYDYVLEVGLSEVNTMTLT